MTLLMGSAVFTRHDAHTRHVLDGFRARLHAADDLTLVAASLRAETLPGHGVADAVRSIVEAEISRRSDERPEFAAWLVATLAEAVHR